MNPSDESATLDDLVVDPASAIGVSASAGDDGSRSADPVRAQWAPPVGEPVTLVDRPHPEPVDQPRGRNGTVDGTDTHLADVGSQRLVGEREVAAETGLADEIDLLVEPDRELDDGAEIDSEFDEIDSEFDDGAEIERYAAPADDTVDGEAVDSDITQEIAEPRHERLPRLGVLAVMLVVIAARFAFAYDRTIYQLAPDEPGSLAMARYLSGGVRFTMFDFNTWRPGLAVLLAPVNAITDDPPQLMHAAFLINAVIAAIATILLARLAVRLTTLPRWACLFAAAAISLTASSLSASAHVWAESLVTLSTLWLIWALIRFFDDPRLGPALSASTAVAVGVLSHGRLLPLLPTMAVVVAVTFIHRRRFDRLWIWGAYTVVVSLATILFTNWVFAEVWDDPGETNTVGTVLDRLINVPAVGRSAVGQLWYQLVVTFGIFGVGVAIVVWHALKRRRRLPLARDARVMLLVTVPLIVTSIAFMSERTRTDHRIYGRYNDAIVWPILIVGIGWLASRVGWWRRLAMLVGVAAATIGAGALVQVLDGEAMAESVGVRPMIAGFLPIVGTASSLDPWLLTAVGVGGTVIVFVLLSMRRLAPLTVTVVVVLLAIGGYRTHEALATRLNSWAAAGEVVEIDQIVDPTVPLAFRMVRDKEEPAASWVEQRRRSLLYQVYLPDHAFERDEGPDDGGSPYVFAPLDDPVMTEENATLVWTDPTVKIGLWVEQGAPYDPLETELVTSSPGSSPDRD